MKYFIEENTLTGIGDAIRGKNGTSDLIPVTGLADAITNLPTGGGGAELPTELNFETDIFGNHITDYIGYINYYGALDPFIKVLPKLDIRFGYSGSQCFYKAGRGIDYNSKVTLYISSGGGNRLFMDMLSNSAPKLIMDTTDYNMLNQLFSGCKYIRELDDYYLYQRNLTTGELKEPLKVWCVNSKTTAASGCNNAFSNCYSLRKHPIIKDLTFNNVSGGLRYSAFFSGCYALDEIIDFPVTTLERTANMFVSTFMNCERIKRFTFATNEDGSPIVAPWSNQTVDLSLYVGYATASHILNYNSGITSDKVVGSVEAYEALKNDPDWYTLVYEYCRYNKESAIETINSLPDCKSGTGNVLKLKGNSGRLLPMGAINTLTEEQIAVATAKGWTVSFT